MNTKRILNSILLFSSISAFVTIGYSQEGGLVENGSFEQISGKIKKLGNIESATGWLKPTGQAADIYAPASKVPDVSTPDNAYGKEDPYSGSNYAGIVAYSYNDKMPRSYLMTKLTQPLKKGVRYCVTFYVSLAEASKYATNSIGGNFSKKPYASAEKASIIGKMDVARGDDKVLSGFYGWDKVCNVYTAEGGEKYFTIGNFVNNNQVTAQKMKMPKYYRGQQIIAAYYYIDNISVQQIDDVSECDCSIKSTDDKTSELIFLKSVTVTDKMDNKQKVEAQEVFFGYGESDVTTSNDATLQYIAQQMKANPSFRLEIQGHMDNTEVEKSQENTALQGLDEARAEAVKDYLVDELKVFGSRITTVGQSNNVKNDIDITEGDDQELIDAKSRRVTFLIKQ